MLLLGHTPTLLHRRSSAKGLLKIHFMMLKEVPGKYPTSIISAEISFHLSTEKQRKTTGVSPS